MRGLRRLLLLLVLLPASLGRPPLDAQVRPVYDIGAAGLVQALQRLETTASALHIAAHPDDEHSAFVTRVSRGDHARIAYLSLNRGEGGQNIIGPELFDALGVVRTEELIQAKRLYLADQFFTRTYDFGFSKTRAEAAAKWNERDVLADMVRAIRMFRPLIVYSRWQGTAADGHGQHQLAGYLAPLAFEAAADPAAFPEQQREGLRPWQALKLYLGTGFQPNPATAPTLRLETGIFDPVLGRTYAEIAAEGRSLHRSQQQGGIEPKGPATASLRLVRSLVETPSSEQSVFDGIDTSIEGIARLAKLPPQALGTQLAAMDAAARSALEQYAPRNPSTIVPALASGVTAVRAAREALRTLDADANARAEADFLLAIKEQDFTDALVHAAGVVVDPLADAETVVQGGSVAVAIRTFVPAGAPVTIRNAELKAPSGWTVGPGEPPRQALEQPTHAAYYSVRLPIDAPLTQPYWLRQPRRGDMYEWDADDPQGLSFAPPLLNAVVTADIGGIDVHVTRPVEYRYADSIRGELRREVNVVPAIAVGLDSPLFVVPLGASSADRRVVIRAKSFSPTAVTGTLRLRVPQGWTVTPRETRFTLSSRDATTSAAFTVRPPARRMPGSFEITAEAVTGESVYARDLEQIEYPHIQTHRLYWPAAAKVQVFDLEVARVRVGYVMGSGDEVPDALQRMGVDVTLLDDEMLTTGDLSRFDTIVVGVRASEARPAFVANHGRLLQYVERGGTLIVQYQQTDYAGRDLPPYPAQQPGNSRVTDETAPVRILEPGHPVFTFPNRITAADFDGWVQERDLYAWVTFDPRYTPLLESADPDEPPQRGGELYARVGEGQYVYTAYAWFRQLRAGVPGAYRQFANLISLSKAPRTAGSRAAGAARQNGGAAPQAPNRTRPSR